jgi:hypothetical protein
VDRAGQELLAGPGLALDQHRHRRARHLDQLAERAHQRRREGEQARRRHRQIGRLAVGRERHRRRAVPLAEAEEGVAELEQVAILEHRALVTLAVDGDAVLGAGVLQDPAAHVAHQAGMDLRHARVRHADGETADSLAVGAGGAPHRGAPDHHLVQLGQRVARRRGERPVALEQEVEARPAALDRVLALRVVVASDRPGQIGAHHFGSTRPRARSHLRVWAAVSLSPAFSKPVSAARSSFFTRARGPLDRRSAWASW